MNNYFSYVLVLYFFDINIFTFAIISTYLLFSNVYPQNEKYEYHKEEEIKHVVPRA